MLGENDPYDELNSPLGFSLTIFYVLATLLLVVIMLNLLISIVSTTHQRVSEMNELIYEKNRVFIIREYLSVSANQTKIRNLLDNKYLIKICNKKSKFEEKKSIESDIDEVKHQIGKIEKKFDNLEVLLFRAFFNMIKRLRTKN